MRTETSHNCSRTSRPQRIGSLVVAVCSMVATAPLAASDHYRIDLPNRSFVPKPGVESVLLGQHRLARPRMVQVWEEVTAETAGEIKELGFELLEQLQPLVWSARVETAALWKKLPPAVRWVGEIEPEDKMSPELCKRGLEAPSMPTDLAEPVEVIVEAQPGLSIEEIYEKLTRHGSRHRPVQQGDRWTLRVDRENLVALAALDEVRSLTLDRKPR